MKITVAQVEGTVEECRELLRTLEIDAIQDLIEKVQNEKK